MAEKKRSGREQAELRRRREACAQILVIGDPVLRERAGEVAVFDRRLAKLARRMIRIMHDASGVGLAAPQIGVLRRMLVYDVGEDEPDPRVLINPVLDEPSEDTEELDEGCLSVPGAMMPVTRAVSVRVRGADETGAPLDFRAEGPRLASSSTRPIIWTAC